MKELGVEAMDVPLVLEGGSFHTDGQGTLLTTKECLLNSNRNPKMNMTEIEEVVCNTLNIKKVIWLEKGLFGDETDGHIDNIACFVAPGKILIQTCEDVDNPNYTISRDNIEILKRAKLAGGMAIEVVSLPGPPVRYYRGKSLAMSYLNFYIANDAIILPIFGGDAKESDDRAVSTMKKLFPDRDIVTTNGMALVKEGGNVHCITQQIPYSQKLEL